MKIKVTKFGKRPVVKFNHTKFIGFKIGSMPEHFAIHNKRKPIKEWFNSRGYTWIASSLLTESFVK